MRYARSGKVEAFASLFRGRRDVYVQMERGNFIAVHRTVSLLHYRLHLEGKLRLGIYPVMSGGVTHFLVLDFDGPESWAHAFEVFQCAVNFDLPLAWEISKSRDVHLWLFFSAPAPARAARLVAQMLLDDAGEKAEIFPKQDGLPEGGVGNSIMLPLSGELVKQGRTIFIDPIKLLAYPDQLMHLSRIGKVTPEKLDELVEINGLKEDEHIHFYGGKNRIFSGDLLPCAKRMLEGVQEGCRDVAAFRLAIHLKSRGTPIQEAELRLQEWNAMKNRPPLAPRVITAKIRSAYQRGYRGYGCEDPLILPFCDESCPIKQKMLTATRAAEENSQ